MKLASVTILFGALTLGYAWAQTAPAPAPSPAAPASAAAAAPASDASASPPNRVTVVVRGGAAAGGTGGTRETELQLPPPNPPPLKENISLSIKAEVVSGVPIDLVFTGAGSIWQANVPLPNAAVKDLEQKNLMLIEAVVTETDGGYLVEYSLAASLPTTAPGRNGGPDRPTFRDVGLKGKATLKLGEQVESTPASNTGAAGKTVTLKITQPAKK